MTNPQTLRQTEAFLHLLAIAALFSPGAVIRVESTTKPYLRPTFTVACDGGLRKEECLHRFTSFGVLEAPFISRVARTGDPAQQHATKALSSCKHECFIGVTTTKALKFISWLCRLNLPNR